MATFPQGLRLSDLGEVGCGQEIKRPMAWSPEDEESDEEKAIIRQLDKNIIPVVTILFL